MLAEPPAHLHTTRALDEAWELACSDDELHARCGRARALPRRLARAGRLALLPGTRLHLPRPSGERAAQPRAARLDPRARRLRLHGRVGDRGLRPDLTRQRRPARVLAARHGARPVRDGLPLRRGEGFFEYDRGHLSRDVDRMAVRLADATYRGAILATHLNETGRERRQPTCSPPTGSRTPTASSTTCAPTTGSRRAPRRGRRRFEDTVGARRHLAVPVRARSRASPHAEGQRVRLVRRGTRLTAREPARMLRRRP